MSNQKQSRRNVLRSIGAATVFGLTGTATASPSENADLVRVNIGYESETGRRAAEAAAASVEHRFAFDALTAYVNENAVAVLRERRDVRYVERDGTATAISPGNGNGNGPNKDKNSGSTSETLEWGVDRVDADVSTENGYTGYGADVAIIDTGIDSDHPDLEPNLGSGKAYVESKGNYQYPWDDDNDHGTHCAGIAGAVNNSRGVVGVAPSVTLHAVKVLDKQGTGYISDVAAGIEYTADQDWDVGNLSLGADSGSYALRDAVQYAASKGVLLIAAAGNDGPCTGCVSYPAAYSDVVAVSATTESDAVASYSSTGDAVEIAAPGSNVYSTIPGGYAEMSGTSMAAPHTAGAGSVLMASGKTATDARDTLTSSAEDLGYSSTETGAGLLDVAAAVGVSSTENLA